VEPLTRIQRDVLIITAGIGPTEGVTISDELNGYYYSSVTTQQVYHALEGLIDAGLISKNPEGTSNYYSITDDGRRAISRHRSWQNTVRSEVDGE
jgi:DNA-binding PadR family transcriptional regulator